jgi:hypothetical protein
MAGQLTLSTLSDGTNSTSSTNAIKGSAKAWVNFNGSTNVIRDSYNVTSITKNGSGDYTINFTNAMPNANYAVAYMGGVKNIAWGLPLFAGLSGYGNSDALATNRFRAITVTPADSAGDTPIICYTVFCN